MGNCHTVIDLAALSRMEKQGHLEGLTGRLTDGAPFIEWKRCCKVREEEGRMSRLRRDSDRSIQVRPARAAVYRPTYYCLTCVTHRQTVLLRRCFGPRCRHTKQE
jgi:hypothetical protein